MGLRGFVVLLLHLKILKIQCQINISVLHIHDNDWYSKEVVQFVASALNNLDDFNVHVDLIQQHKADCKAITSAFKEKPLHIIIDTLRHHENRILPDLGIPTVSTAFENDILNNLNVSHFYRVQHPSESLQNLLYCLIEFLKIDNVLVVYDPHFFYLETLKMKLQQNDVAHLFLRYNNQTTTLKVIQYLNYNNIFFLGDDNIKSLSKIVATNNDHVWYILSTVPTNVTILSDLFIYPIFGRPVNQKFSAAAQHKGKLLFNFYADVAMLAMIAARDFVEVADWDVESMDCFKSKLRENSVFNFVKYLKKSQTIFSVIELDRNPGTYHFMTRILVNSTPSFNDLGFWYSEEKDRINLKHSDYWKSLKRGRNLKILAIVKPPFIYQNYTESQNLYGYCIDMIEELATILNFTYKLYPTSNIMDMVEDITKYDVALGGIRTSSKLMQYLEFTEPFYKPVGIGILLKRPPNSSIFKFITVMESTVWLCVICAYFINSFMIWAFERWSPYSYRNNQEQFADEDDNRDFTLKESLWFCIMSITPQGGGDVPKHFSGRMAVISWWIFGFIVLSSYMANLSAFLTLSKLKSSVESFEDLAKLKTIQYATLNNSEEMEFFNDMHQIENLLTMQLRKMGNENQYENITVWEYSLESVYSKLYSNMQNVTFPQTMNEAVKKVKSSRSETEGFALIGEISDIRYVAMLHCDLEVADDEISRIPYALAVKKNSYLKGFLNKGIFDLMANRRFEHYEQKWWDDNPHKAGDCVIPEDHWQGVGVQNIGGVFLIIFVGIGIACLTIFYEYVMYRYREKKGSNIIRLTGVEEPRKTRDKRQTRATAVLEEIEKY